MHRTGTHAPAKAYLHSGLPISFRTTGAVRHRARNLHCKCSDKRPICKEFAEKSEGNCCKQSTFRKTASQQTRCAFAFSERNAERAQKKRGFFGRSLQLLHKNGELSDEAPLLLNVVTECAFDQWLECGFCRGLHGQIDGFHPTGIDIPNVTAHVAASHSGE